MELVTKEPADIGKVLAGEAPGTIEHKPSEVDFFRCMSCDRLITQLEMRRALNRFEGRMPCGHLRVIMDNMRTWEWILPRVWIMALWVSLLEFAGER